MGLFAPKRYFQFIFSAKRHPHQQNLHHLLLLKVHGGYLQRSITLFHLSEIQIISSTLFQVEGKFAWKIHNELHYRFLLNCQILKFFKHEHLTDS